MALLLCINNCAWWHPIFMLECWWGGWEREGGKGPTRQGIHPYKPRQWDLSLRTEISLFTGSYAADCMGQGTGRPTNKTTHTSYTSSSDSNAKTPNWGCVGLCGGITAPQFIEEHGWLPGHHFRCAPPLRMENLLWSWLIHAKMSFTASTHILVLNTKRND